MNARKLLVVSALLATLGWVGPLPGRGRGQVRKRPMRPRTGRHSVQMFQGGTHNCWIAVWPPNTYEDGTPIPRGTKVQVKVYRSYDGGNKYRTRGVTIVAGGKGFVGQGEENARIKRWIDCKLRTPVDNKKPYAVWLAASVIINGVESKATNRYLTFRYKTPDGRPRLLRYETPDINGVAVDDELARPLPQELPGTWGSGEFVITMAHVNGQGRSSGGKDGREEEIIRALGRETNKPMPLVVAIKQIDLVGAPGMGGNPVDPRMARKIHFPGTLTWTVGQPQPGGTRSRTEEPNGFMYNYRDRSIRLDKPQKGTVTRIGGHFFQNATHYSIRGTWKMTLMRGKTDVGWVRGTWMVKKRKR